MLSPRLTTAVTHRSALPLNTRLLPQPFVVNQQRRQFSRTRPALTSTLPVQIHGKGSGVAQSITVEDKPYTVETDTYTTLGGNDAHPSPVVYALASLGSCNQVTGSIVARDHGIQVGQWDVDVKGELPTDVLVGGEQGNPNWVSVEVKIRVQTDLDAATEEGEKEWKFFASEVERRCPITQLFKRSGVRYQSDWVNEKL